MTNTVVWDGKTLATNRADKSKRMSIRTPSKGYTWTLLNENVLGYAFVGDPRIADLFEQMLSGIDFMVELGGTVESQLGVKGEITALVITKGLIANRVVYSIKNNKASLTVLPGVGKTAIGKRSIAAIACLSIGVDAIKAITSSVNNYESIATKMF